MEAAHAVLKAQNTLAELQLAAQHQGAETTCKVSTEAESPHSLMPPPPPGSHYTGPPVSSHFSCHAYRVSLAALYARRVKSALLSIVL